MKKNIFTLFIMLLTGILGTQVAFSQSIKTLSILFTNDVHGGIVETRAEFLNPEFPPVLGGGAAIYNIIKDVRAKQKNDGREVWISDAGDIFQGTVLGTKSAGEAVVKYLNYIKTDWVVPGNHDFDKGKENIIKLINQSQFPWIACNIIDKTTGNNWEMVKPYVIRDAFGLKIGVTGICTAATEQMAFPENIKNLHFEPEIIALRKTVKKLREEEKVDLVIAVVHTGLPYNLEEGLKRLEEADSNTLINRLGVGVLPIARYVKGIDIMFGGHIHKGYQKPYEDPVNHTLCFQNYGNGGNIGWIDFKIDTKSKSLVGYKLPVLNNDLLLMSEDAYPVNRELYQLIKEEQKKYEAGFHEIVGETKVALTRKAGESLMGNVVCDAMLEAARADFSFTNGGGIRADIKMGKISYRDLFRVLPFGNQLVVAKVKGRFLKKIIEAKVKGYGRGLLIGGGTVVVDTRRPDGDRVTTFLIDGKPLDPEKDYRIVTSDYLMEGNSGLKLLLDIPENHKSYPGVLMLDALVQYVQKHNPLKPELDGRWKKINPDS